MSSADSPNDSGGSADSYSYDDGVVRQFAAATICWAIIAALLGLVVSLLLVSPKMFSGIPEISFGRLRPVYVNAAVFAFIGNAVFAGVYYSTQRLCKSRMWSDALSQVHFWGWQLVVLASLVTIPMGMTQGKQYAEAEWPIDIAMAVIWIGCFAVNFFMTLAERRERRLYVSLWFFIASVLVVSIIHPLNNLVYPLSAGKGISIYAGVQDAMMQWWYGQNLYTFFMTMPLLGLMYYFIPKATGNPIFSYKLAIAHFWSLVALSAWAAPHHLSFTALPEWASSLGMLFALMLWMPAWGGMINGMLTLRGGQAGVRERNPVLNFFFIALICYAVAVFEGTLLSVKSIGVLTQYTDWQVAHTHFAALGWNAMFVFGMIYWLMPRLFQTKLWNETAVTVHFWLSIVGIVLYVVPMYISGWTQSSMWRAMNETGNLSYIEFVETIPAITSMWWLRMVGGGLFGAGLLLMGLNFIMTWSSHPATYSQSVNQFEQEVTPKVELDTTSALDDAPVLRAAMKMAVASRLDWHRVWEYSAARFAWLTVLAVGLAALFQLVPIVGLRAGVAEIKTVKPYTPLELIGRDIYVREGCVNCHTQMVRPTLDDYKRYRDFSVGGEFVYDRPFQWGDRRVGPDLAREGGRRPSFWHWKHLEDPRRDPDDPDERPDTVDSVMPSFAHILDARIGYDGLQQRVRAANTMGAPYEEELTDAVVIAKKQAELVAADIVSAGGPIKRGELMTLDSKGVALIAYLQRLGVDRFAPPPAVEPESSEAAGAEPEPEDEEE